MANILIIDDDHQICKILEKRFERMDHQVACSLSLNEGLETLFANEFDIVFLDVNLPDGNGLEAINVIKEHPEKPEIIIMTGEGDAYGAELAMKLRVWDYIQKSGSFKEFKFSLIRALDYRQQKQSVGQKLPLKREAIIGESSQIKACLEMISKASNNDVPVFITGETGTGKELFSKAIHENSNRCDENFIVVDCTALPEHLVESVLFGHTKGAFTGADSDKTGLIKMADEGTLFLDEVGELPLVIQKKFLRALQEKSFRPVGGKKEISSNFRLISATHRDVEEMVKECRFREDFYFRIASLKIEIPPLRFHKTDIVSLVGHHMKRKQELYNGFPHELSQVLIDDLLGYDWPGNVRELFNTMDYACSDAYQETLLFPKHLPESLRAFNIKNKLKKHIKPEQEICSTEQKIPVGEFTLKDYIETKKHKYILDLIAHTHGDVKTSCRLSGLSRGHLYTLLKKYNISDS